MTIEPSMPAVMSREAQPSDAALLASWNEHGRREDFEELVRRHLPLVEGTSRRVLGEDLARDTVQVVFAILVRKAPRLTGVRSLAAWLHRVTMLQCRNAIRRLQADRRRQSAVMQQALLNEGRDPLEDVLPHLDAAIAALSDADRSLILMRYSEGVAFAEAAKRTGRSEAALRQQAGRALEKLGAQLRRRGVMVPAAALATGLDAVLQQPAVAGAAVVAGSAIRTAGDLSRGAVWAVSFATMNTAQSILTGTAIAALLASGPIWWRSAQIRDAELNAGTARPVVPGTIPPEAALTDSPAKPVLSPSAGSRPAKPAGTLEELEAALTEEFSATAEEWARLTAWLDARRISHAAGLLPGTEHALRQFLHERTARRIRESNEDGVSAGAKEGRLARIRELNAWMQEHLNSDELARWQESERIRRTTMVELAAESALHRISTAVPLTDDQKTRLYDLAAAKAVAALDADDGQNSVSIMTALTPAPPPGMDEDTAILASVLDEGQMELRDQAREQHQMFTEVMPRRAADRALEVVRRKGLGPTLLQAIGTAFQDDEESSEAEAVEPDTSLKP